MRGVYFDLAELLTGLKQVIYIYIYIYTY